MERDTVSNYDHAAELARSRPPGEKLAFLVKELRRWAARNPALVSLYAEFQAVQDELASAPKPVTVTIVLQDDDNDLDGVLVKHDGEPVWQENSVGDMGQYFRHTAPKGVPVILEVPET
jgi:ribosome biogenesis protein Nip4